MIHDTQKNIIKLLCIFTFLASPAFSMKECTEETPEETCVSLKPTMNFSISLPIEIYLESPINTLFFTYQNSLLIATLEDQTNATINLDYKFEVKYSEPKSQDSPNTKNLKKEKSACYAVGPNKLLARCLEDETNIEILATNTADLVATIKTGMPSVQILIWSDDGFWIAATSGKIVKIWQLWPI